jgi:hypothetical protein
MADIKVGVDGLAFVEKALTGHSQWQREEGVPPTFGDDLRKLTADTLAAENATRLVVVFDGLCNTSVLEAAKSRASEDVLLWAANFLCAESAPSAVAKLSVDVIFAPYLAAPQLVMLQTDGAISRIVTSLCGLHLQSGREHELAAYAPCLSYTAGAPVRLRVTSEDAPPPETRVAIAELFGRHALGLKNPLYYLLLAAGVCSPALLRIIAQRRITVEETAEKVREIEGYMMPLRAQIAFQFPLIRDIHKDSLRPEDPQVLAGMQNPPIIELDPWDLPLEQPPSHVHLLSVLQAYHACAVQTPTQELAPQHVLPVILLRSMDLMGYFTHNSSDRDGEENGSDVSSCSVFGQALSAVSEVIGDATIDPALIDAAFVLIELIRTEGIAVDGTADDDGDTMARKLAALVPVRVRCVRAKDMKSPAEFIGAAQMIRRLLRQLVESIAAGVLQSATVTSQQRLTGAALNDIATRLPFTAVPSNRGAMLFLQTSMFGTAASSHFVGNPSEDVWRRDFANLNMFARMVHRIIQTFQEEDAFIDHERLSEVTRGATRLFEATKQYVQ